MVAESAPAVADLIDNDASVEESPITARVYRRLQVQVVHRHGDRSPITSLKDEDYWSKQLIPEATLKKISSLSRIVENGEKNTHKANGRGPFGKLTELGLQQMVDLGSFLRKELWSDRKDETIIDQEGNILYPHVWTPDRPLSPSNLRIISTSFERAVQSAQGVLAGLFPNGSDIPIEIDARHTNILLPDPQPRRTREQELLEDKLAVRPHLRRREEELLPLAIRVTQALHPLLAPDAREASFGAKQESISTESIEIEPLAWNQLGELTKCLAVRNMLPAGLSEEDHHSVVQHAAWRWFETFRHPRLAYLGMNALCIKMVDFFVNHPTEPPVTLYSAHDSTLIGLLCALKLEQPVAWPEYGSYLMVELLEEVDSSQLYVRFSLNGQVLKSNWEGTPANMILLQTLADKLRNEGEATAAMTS